ncbi:MAG: DUF2490 domain-containing protein [Saprospiraceae bacterium]
MKLTILIHLLIIFALFQVSTTALLGQDIQRFGVLPSLLLRTDLTDRTGLSLGFSSETDILTIDGVNRRTSTKVLNLNLEAALSVDPTPNFNLAAGFLYRFRDPFAESTTELRPWQQLTFIQRWGKYKFRNRIRAEQRWFEQATDNGYDFDLRVRYRVSTDFPLSGERLDNHEFYLNLSLEALFTPTRPRPLYYSDNRVYIGLGYQINAKHRIEPAIEIRTRRIALDKRLYFSFFRFIWITTVGN